VIELRAHGPETGLDVAQAFAVGQLREDHRQVLVPTSKAAWVLVATIAGYALLEFFVGKMFNQLRENGAACVLAPLFRCCRAGGRRF
jgi:hypothetical protein